MRYRYVERLLLLVPQAEGAEQWAVDDEHIEQQQHPSIIAYDLSSSGSLAG